ncbi:MAG: hypothetical protein K8R11_03130 [Methanococcoides sp.]|nr:hypothetical protein [Methanococcoides sp.]
MLLIVISMSFPANATPFAGGNGTAGNPYQISTVDQLQSMSGYLSANYKLINDIDASSTINWNSGAGFEPIGRSSDKFKGFFDGQGYEITGLYINRPSKDHVGLFGMTDGSEIKNVGLKDVNIIGSNSVGGLVGRSYCGSAITQSYTSGNVIGEDRVGGLVGYSSGTIIQSYSVGNVTGKVRVGGLVGHSSGTITQSYASGNVIGEDRVGGLVGRYDCSRGVITQSYASGNVTGEDRVGGLVGINYGSIEQSYANGKVTSEDTCKVGGIVGINSGGSVKKSYWDTQTSDQDSGVRGTGKTTAEMKARSTYSGWDFTSVWSICNDASSS